MERQGILDTLDKYLVKEFLSYFFLILSGIALLYLGIDFLTKFWGFQWPIGRVVLFYSYRIPHALQQFTPVSCLMSTLLVLSNMSRQNEVLALYSNGIGTMRLVSTFIALVATISTVSFLIFDSFVPVFAKKQLMLQQGLDPSSDQIMISAQTGLWYRSRKLIYNVGRFEPTTNEIQDITAYRLGEKFRLTEIISAPTGHFIDNDWVLKNGHSIHYDDPSGFPRRTTFETFTNIIPEKPKDFKAIDMREDTMRLKDLRKYIDKNSGFGLDTTSQAVHYHERVAFVFSPLVFVLLAFPFALHPLKTQSMARAVGFCFLVVFLYLLIMRMALSIGKGGHIPPTLAAWVPNAVFLCYAGLKLLRRR